MKKQFDLSLKTFSRLIVRLKLKRISIARDHDMMNVNQNLHFIDRLTHFLGDKMIEVTFYQDSLNVP